MELSEPESLNANACWLVQDPYGGDKEPEEGAEEEETEHWVVVGNAKIALAAIEVRAKL